MADHPPPVIAIDGPSASGKGTVAQEVARRLGFHYLDSGALYRLVALAAMQRNADLENELEVANIALNIKVSFRGDTVQLDGRTVTDDIRSEAVGVAASRVAALPNVRGALLHRQHAFRQPPGLVAEGRDMGSVVFPDAALKVFLTATAEERARRRYKQLMEKGMRASMTTLLQDIRERDARDCERAVAPLRKSDDAVEIDTTGLPVAAVTSQILAQYRRALRAP